MVLFNNQKFERTRTPPLRQYNFKGFRLEGFERVLFLFISCLFVCLSSNYIWCNICNSNYCSLSLYTSKMSYINYYVTTTLEE